MISVCLASYNGEEYIYRQVNSILAQLDENDELIISDDSSTDRTIEIVESFKDSRIVVLKGNKFHSPVLNFENALKHAKGEFIFLSDQDDVWLDGRVKEATKLLARGEADCVICNRKKIDKEDNVISESVVEVDFTQLPFWKALLRNRYIGCCMAFNKTLLDLSLPFPEDLPMHDLWIGLLAHKQHRVAFIEKPLVAYRRHDGNVTTGKSPYPVWYRIKYRLSLLSQLKHRLNRINN